MSDAIKTPVGTVMMWAGGTNQAAILAMLLDGWILCDGSAYDTGAQFKDLFAVIGESYGGGNGQFCSPSYKGMFIRGVTGTTDRDPDAAQRGAPRPDEPNRGNTGKSVGSVQADEVGSHAHSYDYFNDYHESTHTAGHQCLSGQTTAQMSATKGSETRSINQYVNFVIKATSSADGVPPGAVLPYAGSHVQANTLAAAGWLLCDGAKLSASKYPKLQSMISPYYGSDTDVYCLPDYRGRFLRGVQGQAIPGLPVADPDAATRTAPQPDLPHKGNVGNQVGSVQDAELKGHGHDYTYNNSYWNTAATAIGADERANDSQAESAGSNSSETESRPINIYSNFIIKAE